MGNESVTKVGGQILRADVKVDPGIEPAVYGPESCYVLRRLTSWPAASSPTRHVTRPILLANGTRQLVSTLVKDHYIVQA